MAEKNEQPAEKEVPLTGARAALKAASEGARSTTEAVISTSNVADEVQANLDKNKEEVKATTEKAMEMKKFIHSLAQAATINAMADTTEFNETLNNMAYQINVRHTEYEQTFKSVEESVAGDNEKARLLADIKLTIDSAMEQYAEWQGKQAKTNELLKSDPQAVPQAQVIEEWSYIIGAYKKLQEGLNAYDKLRGEYKHFARYFAPQAALFDRPTGKNSNTKSAEFVWAERTKKINGEIQKTWADYDTFLAENSDPRNDTKEISEIRARLEHADALYREYLPKYAESQDNKNIVFMSKYLMETALDEYFLFERKVKEKVEELENTPQEPEAAQKETEVAAANKKIEEATQTPVQPKSMLPETPVATEKVEVIDPLKQDTTLQPDVLPRPIDIAANPVQRTEMPEAEMSLPSTERPKRRIVEAKPSIPVSKIDIPEETPEPAMPVVEKPTAAARSMTPAVEQPAVPVETPVQPQAVVEPVPVKTVETLPVPDPISKQTVPALKIKQPAVTPTETQKPAAEIQKAKPEYDLKDGEIYAPGNDIWVAYYRPNGRGDDVREMNHIRPNQRNGYFTARKIENGWIITPNKTLPGLLLVTEGTNHHWIPLDGSGAYGTKLEAQPVRQQQTVYYNNTYSRPVRFPVLRRIFGGFRRR